MAARRQTRERLIDAAADLFWTRGFEGASIADIAAAAGLPAGNVFYHFRAKADLARAVTRLFVEDTAAALARIDRRGGEPPARVAAFLDLLADSIASRVARGCPIARAAREFPPDPEAPGPGAVFRLMIDWLAARLAESGRADADAAAASAVARWQGAIVLASALADAGLLAGEIAALRRDLAAGTVTGSSGPAA